MLKTYFDHISEIIEVRDLIFDTGTPYDIENTMFQFGQQALQVAPSISKKFILTISQKLLKLETCQEHLFLIHQRLVSLEPQDLAQILLHTW